MSTKTVPDLEASDLPLPPPQPTCNTIRSNGGNDERNVEVVAFGTCTRRSHGEHVRFCSVVAKDLVPRKCISVHSAYYPGSKVILRIHHVQPLFLADRNTSSSPCKLPGFLFFGPLMTRRCSDANRAAMNILYMKICMIYPTAKIPRSRLVHAVRVVRTVRLLPSGL